MDNQELKFLVIQSQTSALNYLDSNDWNDYTSDELAELNGLITEKIKELEMKSFRNQSIIGLLLLVFLGIIVF